MLDLPTSTLPDWTTMDRKQRLEIVAPLWKSGLSASQISEHFTGCTRNAIIGTVTRANLARSKTGIATANPTKPKRPTPTPAPKRDRNSIPGSRPPPVERDIFDAIRNERDPLPGIEPIGILDLPSRPGVRCRFMVRGQLYCGKPSGEHTYCETHMAIAYRPTEPMKINGKRK